MRKADDKKGVILVTIIFIVAMALLFITTALTISIASRQRVYANAKSDQARLTVTSLAQSIWQAIYSQQINDDMVNSLAKSGSLVRFSDADVPGMIAGTSAESTAYFYVIETGLDGEPSKIGIECKCNIDGETQYYRMVLLKNVGEGVPSPMFNLTVDIGNGGLLNSCDFGIDASQVTGNARTQQVRYDAEDNVVFIHGNTSSDQDGSGFYTTLLTDGIVYLRDTVIAHQIYFLGENAGFDFRGTSQTNAAARNSQVGDMIFWGTRVPFRNNGAVMAADSSPSVNLAGVRNVYFDMQDNGADASPRYTGFEDCTTNFGGTMGVSGGFYYEQGSDTHFTHPGSWHREAQGVDHTSDIQRYLTTDPNELDTQSEVIDTFRTPYYSSATEIDFTSSSISAGYYKVSNARAVNSLITCNVSGGDIVIFLDAPLSIARGGSGPAGFQINGSGEHNVYFILNSSSATFQITGGDGDWAGLVDWRCFSGTPTSYTNINQTQVPRFYILSTYSGGQQIKLLGNHDLVLSSMIGLFPSTQGGSDGGILYVYSAVTDKVFYGRIACGGLSVDAGGELLIPYCPTVPGDITMRNEAYRDNTDFSVVPEECGYFTA